MIDENSNPNLDVRILTQRRESRAGMLLVSLSGPTSINREGCAKQMAVRADVSEVRTARALAGAGN